MSSGLGEDWERILDDLSVIAPIYEKGNRVLSLGRSSALRKRAVTGNLPDSGVFVDVGCGPGSMSVEAVRRNPSLEAVLVDPLPVMLRYAGAQAELGEASLVMGVYECLPFRDSSFAAYLAGFTLRDARDRGAAIGEASRALREGGTAVVLDLGRPDSAAKRWLVAAYWRLISPVLLFVFLRGKGRPFRDIYVTVRKLPTNTAIQEQFSKEFADVKVRREMLDGVLLIVARKASA
jgi:demethylmenaquinone methyltransferase/2-methoxy-6-polyprenyl-1,4-benzoquinol methylase